MVWVIFWPNVSNSILLTLLIHWASLAAYRPGILFPLVKFWNFPVVRTRRQGELMRGRSQKKKPGTEKVPVGTRLQAVRFCVGEL